MVRLEDGALDVHAGPLVGQGRAAPLDEILPEMGALDRHVLQAGVAALRVARAPRPDWVLVVQKGRAPHQHPAAIREDRPTVAHVDRVAALALAGPVALEVTAIINDFFVLNECITPKVQ